MDRLSQAMESLANIPDGIARLCGKLSPRVRACLRQALAETEVQDQKQLLLNEVEQRLALLAHDKGLENDAVNAFGVQVLERFLERNRTESSPVHHLSSAKK